tara:strand:- start:531 stop:1022 length:492 start_codon:yes stop_codon:yes gene_type:complete
MAEYEIIDNFLPQSEFEEIENIMKNMPWYYLDFIAHDKKVNKDNSFYFYHMLYFDNRVLSNDFERICSLLLNKITIKSLVRLKANLYPSTSKVLEHDYHVDFPYEHKGGLFSINTCNGYTKLEDGSKIKSKANRLLLFDSSKNHASTNCSDERIRINLNINYF